MAPLNKVQVPPPPPSSQHLHHPMHPDHPLQQIYSSKEFECDGCNSRGSGTRYSCDTCYFDLHTICATCPSTLSSHLHPNHSLSLVNISNSRHLCDLCGDEVDGLFYKCRACNFDVHPLCTELPAHVQHATHPQHVLKLEEHAIPGWCLVCRHTCASWRYRCGTCGVDIHLECVFLVASEAATNSTLVPPSPPLLGQPQTLEVPLPSPNPYGYPMVVTYVNNYNPRTSNVATPSKRRKRDVIFKIVGMVGQAAVEATVQAAVGAILNS